MTATNSLPIFRQHFSGTLLFRSVSTACVEGMSAQGNRVSTELTIRHVPDHPFHLRKRGHRGPLGQPREFGGVRTTSATRRRNQPVRPAFQRRDDQFVIRLTNGRAVA